jgi:deoxyribodipyrimidine photo-lyase
VTWRELGHHWTAHRLGDTRSLRTALPSWAFESLEAHTSDKRAYLYDRATLEAGRTHDPLWNAAQKELVRTGTIHNYLRMLWGKNVLAWSKTPEEAYQTLLYLNDTYALDGRDPNSFSGILWCFGLFDRPWPEREVFGTIRTMTSGSAEKKFDLGSYLAYVSKLEPLPPP